MRFGTSIVLLAVGAVLAFAVNVQTGGVDLRVIGWILMGAGALGIALEAAVFGPRRHRVTRTDSYEPAAPGVPARSTTTDATY